jgi:pyruvate,orthophosphate dikinase
MTEKKWVYLFSDIKEVENYVNNDWEGVRGLLGGKGANLAEMVRIGLPVPPGFIVTTEASTGYQMDQQFPEGLWDQMLVALAKVEKDAGKKFGSMKNPLLVSCRSGAKFSMPGMMDTVLNIGLNDETAKAMINLTQNERFVYDSYRRLIQMFGAVVLGIEDEAFEDYLEGVKPVKRYKSDTQLTPAD